MKIYTTDDYRAALKSSMTPIYIGSCVPDQYTAAVSTFFAPRRVLTELLEETGDWHFYSGMLIDQYRSYRDSNVKDTLRRMCGGNDVILITDKEPYEHSLRIVVTQYLRELGLVVTEFAPGVQIKPIHSDKFDVVRELLKDLDGGLGPGPDTGIVTNADLGAFVGDDLVGALLFDSKQYGDATLVKALYVNPIYRRNGIATKLMDELKSRAGESLRLFVPVDCPEMICFCADYGMGVTAECYEAQASK